jgi:hypothetical protein
MRKFLRSWCFCLLVGFFQCTEDADQNQECDTPILLEDVKPGVGSLQKTPFTAGQLMQFTDSKGQVFQLRMEALATGEEYREDPIPCLEDSSFSQMVRYRILRNRWMGQFATSTPLRSLTAELKVLYNSARPLADERAELLVLKVSSPENDPNGTEIISIPLLDQNYPFQIPEPEILPSLRLGNREFLNVYIGRIEEMNGLKVYLSLKEGLLLLQDTTGWSWTRMP